MFDLKIEELSKEEILTSAVDEILKIDSEDEMMDIICKVSTRARELECYDDFQNKINIRLNSEEGVINFDDGNTLKSTNYHVDDHGAICLEQSKQNKQICSHQLYISRTFKNDESGEYKIELSFKKRGRWRKIIVPRSGIASTTEIIKLSRFGIDINSINAKDVIKYLSSLESENESYISETISTSTLGWKGSEFMPCSCNMVFDEEGFRTLIDSIKCEGDRNLWFKTVDKIYKSKSLPFDFYMAASVASVLVEPCKANPFIVDLYGDTGKGKTVALMLATSVWANPKEGAYITDSKSTPTALEIRLNTLKNLPMMVDDFAQIKTQVKDFSSFVYRVCAGQGRDRSNLNLTINKLTNWRNCTLTNGEHPLSSEASQGGAKNRIIDIELKDEFVKNANEIVSIINENYGWLGHEFVNMLKDQDKSEIRKKYQITKDILKDECNKKNILTEDKQISSLALVMLADSLIKTFFFENHDFLKADDCIKLLKGFDDISENERALRVLRDKYFQNPNRFATTSTHDETIRSELWGCPEDSGNVKFFVSALNKIIKDEGFNPTSFKDWAKRTGIGQDKISKFNLKSCRFFEIRLIED